MEPLKCSTAFSSDQWSSIAIDNGQARTCHRRNNPNLTSVPRTFLLGIDNWLRKIGFFGSVIFTFTMGGVHSIKIYLGYKFPVQVSKKVVTLDVQFSRMGSPGTGISIHPGYLSLQNQVPEDSPFMTACRNGDVALMRQHLLHKTGFLSDRTISSGKTPLLVGLIPLPYVRILIFFV